MFLTVLAIPFIFFGAFVKPYDKQPERCFSVSQYPFCFEHGSYMPEVIKFGSVAFGFGLLYLGRRQIKRRRGES